MITVYAIQSEKDQRIYVGMTKDVQQRIIQHNKGCTRTTKPFIPWNLIYTEELPSYQVGRIREKYFKSGVGKEFLKSLFHRTKD